MSGAITEASVQLRLPPGAERRPDPNDPDIELLVPAHDVAEPEISLVVPALNEQLTVEQFVQWCHDGLARAGMSGEILIVDSSTDSTPELAVKAGARVLRTPKRGLGRAYIDALPYIRGRYVVMGDADCTYDFRELEPFAGRFHEGYEFVMGSRWKGTIEDGSMPALHRYFGTPVTTWILNRLYGSRFSDIHCGMRGITRDALQRMHIDSQSWEYASEMVLKSVHMGLRTTEVPVSFLKDQEGRVSHHKRMGWTSPFRAAWINLRAMFVYGADYFVLKPGLLLLVLGAMLTLLLSGGPVEVAGTTLSLYWELVGATLTVLGLQGVCFGLIARVFYDYSGRTRARLTRLFSYTRTTWASFAAVAAGLLLAAPLVGTWIRNDLALPPEVLLNGTLSRAVLGLVLVICGFMLFTFTLLLHAAVLVVGRERGHH